MITARTTSVAETKKLAAALADLAQPGDLLLLTGDLGAGKTSFVQGYGEALGVETPITSPTFTLANRHEGRLVLNHLDVYRLDRMDEVIDLGLFELLDDRSITVIEWGDAVAAVLPPDYLRIRFTFGDAPDERLLAIEAIGARWQGREWAMASTLRPWSGEGAC